MYLFSTQIRMQRASWGLFRDRRPELYYPISTLDGSLTHRAAVARDSSAAPAKLLPPVDTPKVRGYVRYLLVHESHYAISSRFAFDVISAPYLVTHWQTQEQLIEVSFRLVDIR